MKKVLSLILIAALLVCGVLSATASDISDLEKRKAELESQQEQDKQKLEKQNAAVEEQHGFCDKADADR